MAIVYKTGGALNQALGNVGSSFGEAYSQASKARQKSESFKRLFPSQEDQGNQREALSQNEGFRQNFLNMVGAAEEQNPEAFEGITPEKLDQAWESYVDQGLAQQQQQQQNQPQYSLEQLSAIAQDDPQLAKMIQSQQQQQEQMGLQERKLALQEKQGEEKKVERKEDRAFKRNEELFKKVDKTRQGMFAQEMAVDRIEDALISKDINQYTDWLAGELGMDPLKNTQAQILESGAKELFVSGLEGMSGIRFNQFLEKLLRDAGATLGKSPEANQEYLEATYIALDVKKKFLEIYDELEAEFDAKGLDLPKNASKLIEDKLRPYERKKLSEFKKIKEEIAGGKVINHSGIQMRKAKRKTADVDIKPGHVWILKDGKEFQIPLKLMNGAIADGGRLIE